ncbi:hypothetical protein RCL1_003465 [Eukaryota sp. TZLM3-RCL]
MSTHPNAPEASIRIGPQGLSSSPQTLTLGTTHEGSARPAELPVPQDLSLVPFTVPAVPSAPVEPAPVVAVPSASTESEDDLPLPIYSPVPPFLEEELRSRSAQELLAEFEEPRPSSSLPSANPEFSTIPREWLMSLTELANQGVDIPSLLRSTDPVQVGASVAPVDVICPSRSRPRGSSSISSRIARLSINSPEATTSSPQSSGSLTSEILDRSFASSRQVSSSSSPSNSESTRFRVTPITSFSGADLLGFVRQFAAWSRHFNGDAPFTPLSSENPVHDLDIIRAHLRGVNPTGVQDFVDPFIVDTWVHSCLLNPSRRDCDVWRTICLLSQFESRQQAIHAKFNPSENIRKELTYKLLDPFQGPVLSPLIVGSTDVFDDGKPSGTNPRLVPSNVFLDPVPFRKGSRMAGSNVDLASNPTGKFGKSVINQFETSRSPFLFPLPRVRSDSILIPSYEVSNRSHSILSLTQTVSRPINSGSFLQLQILINDVPVTGTIDTAASCSVISKDLAMSCSMGFVTDSIEYLSANNVTTSSLGSTQGVLTFRLGNIANLVRVSHSLPVIPGSNILLIGTDILTSLGLLNENGVFIKLNREHSVILQDEAKFDHLIPITTADELTPDQISADFSTKLAESDCEITLDDPTKQTRLIKVLESFSEVFQFKPHPDGIDCPPMEIVFHSEDVVVKMKPRNLNPNKLRIARDIFTDLVNSGFAYFTKDSKFGSPIVLVTYPDHRKPRLTGDFSGATGVNANTKTVVPNLPKISDILEFLSSAQFIGTLDLPKAFWQLNVATKDQEKTT